MKLYRLYVVSQNTFYSSILRHRHAILQGGAHCRSGSNIANIVTFQAKPGEFLTPRGDFLMVKSNLRQI